MNARINIRNRPAATPWLACRLFGDQHAHVALDDTVRVTLDPDGDGQGSYYLTAGRIIIEFTARQLDQLAQQIPDVLDAESERVDP